VVAIPFPVNTSPGTREQDGAGRLINIFPEIRQNQQGMVWRRVPGTVTFTNIYPASPSGPVMTVTATFISTNPQGAAAMTGSGTAAFVSSIVTGVAAATGTGEAAFVGASIFGGST
jgi:hypothetical protein